MKWLIAWNSITTNPKWLALTLELRGAWISLMCHASVQQPVRWRFRDEAHAALLLRRDGAAEADADQMVGQLIDAGWLDRVDDWIQIHDHDDWQRYPSDMPDATAERKRNSRARDPTKGNRVTSRHDSVTSRGDREHKTTDGRSPATGGARTSIQQHRGMAEIRATIKERWAMDVTTKQEVMIAEIADRQGEGAKGYHRLVDFLKVQQCVDPVAALKGLDAVTKDAGRRRADAQEAESRYWQGESGHGGPPALLGDVISGVVAPRRTPPP